MEVSPEVPEAEKWRMISKALRVDPHKRLDLKTILREVSRQETAYKRAVAADYILATSISLPPDLRIPPVRSHRTTVTFCRFLPRNVSRKELETMFRLGSHDPHPKGYTAVMVRLKSRSIPEAVKVALDELDYMRGIWNFIKNYGDFGLPGNRRPINRIRLGQVHTLHNRAGNVVDPSYGDYWYEPFYVYEQSSRSIGSDWNIIKTDAQRITRRIRRCSYSSELVRAFIRYGRALDHPDFESVFLKL